MDDARQFVTGVACKAVGGKWSGGHDISGHVFLLVLGSMFLFEEVLHVALKSAMTRERTVYMADGAVKSAEVEAKETTEGAGKWTLGVKVVLGVGGLSLYMLLMTAAYFHTWFEKVSYKSFRLDILLTELVHWVIGSVERHFCGLLSSSIRPSTAGNHWDARSIGSEAMCRFG